MRRIPRPDNRRTTSLGKQTVRRNSTSTGSDDRGLGRHDPNVASGRLTNRRDRTSRQETNG
ncbi:MAG TPA: hypothetical protein DCQ98_02885 [Planctomycetaceae bacterium]|nr:hypothetical protein [Planctomycetaceae bacterium]